MKLDINSYYMLQLYGFKHNNDIWLVKEFIEGFTPSFDGYVVTHYGSIETNGSFQRCYKKKCEKVFIPKGQIFSIYPLSPDWKLIAFDFQHTDVDGECVYNAPGWITNSEWFNGEILI